AAAPVGSPPSQRLLARVQGADLRAAAALLPRRHDRDRDCRGPGGLRPLRLAAAPVSPPPSAGRDPRRAKAHEREAPPADNQRGGRSSSRSESSRRRNRFAYSGLFAAELTRASQSAGERERRKTFSRASAAAKGRSSRSLSSAARQSAGR